MITEELSKHAWHPRLQIETAGARMWQKLVGFWLLLDSGAGLEGKKDRDAPGLVKIPSPVQGMQLLCVVGGCSG